MSYQTIPPGRRLGFQLADSRDASTGRFKGISEEKERLIKELYLQNVPVSEIAERAGLAHPTGVYPVLKRLGVRARNPYRTTPNLEPSETLAYLMGALYGDGSVTFGSISLRVTQLKFAESVAKAMREIGLNARLLPVKTIGKRKEQFNAQCYCRNFVRWYFKTPIDQVLGESRERQLAFLRGFYEAEGSLTRFDSYYKDHTYPYRRVSICNTSLVLAHLVQALLIDMGYSAKLSAYLPHTGFGGEKRGMIYTVALNRQDEVLRFLRETRPCIKNVEVTK